MLFHELRDVFGRANGHNDVLLPVALDVFESDHGDVIRMYYGIFKDLG